jgi:hypothetical protein
MTRLGMGPRRETVTRERTNMWRSILFPCALGAVLGAGALFSLGACAAFDDENRSPAQPDGDAAPDHRDPDGPTDAGPDGTLVDAEVDASNDGGCPGAAACERYVFVTSMKYPGNLGGAAGADAKCNEHAKASGVDAIRDRKFVAWISAGISTAPERTVPGTAPYKLPDETTVAQSRQKLLQGGLEAPIDRDESGNEVDGTKVWTGTNASGGNTDDTCVNWATSVASLSGGTGSPTATDLGWMAGSTEICSTELRLYCFEE